MNQQPLTPEDIRMPPSHLETEQRILGSMMVDAARRELALGRLEEDDFWRTAHQHIFNAIRKCHEEQRGEYDHIAVSFELQKREVLHECGGSVYVQRLEGEHFRDADTAADIRRLRELRTLREMMSLSQRLYAEAEASPDDVPAFVSRMTSELAILEDRALAAAGPGYTTAAVAAQLLGDITWTWDPWLPNGFITLIGGETGVGKSKMALRIVESTVRPRDWPNGDAGPEKPGQVLYVDTEGAQGMQFGRMRAAGLPMQRIIFPGEDGQRHLNLDDPTTIPFVRQTCNRERVRLVVVDSLRSGMSGDENSSEFGEKLQPWGGLARDLGIPIVIVHHANKAGGDREMSLDRIRGSSAITALPRSVIAIDKPDETTDRLRVQQVKNNLSKMAEPFGIELTECGCDIAPVPRSPRTDFRAVEAEEWLREVLRRGPRHSGEIRDLAKAEEITQSTLYRARDAVGIREMIDPENPRKRLWALAASDQYDGV